MAKYSSKLAKATTSTTVGVASIEAPGSSMRRIKLYDVMFGSESAQLIRFLRYRLLVLQPLLLVLRRRLTQPIQQMQRLFQL